VATFSIIADVMVRGLDSLKKLSGAAEDVANETDDASDALGRFGKASGKAGNAAERASLDLEDAASKFRAMGSSGTLAGDTLERFSIITSGPVGAAIGGLIIGTAAATAGFQALKLIVTEGIATNQRYTEQVETLTGELYRTAAILGQVLLDVIDFGDAIETSNTKVKAFNEGLLEDSSKIADSMRDVISFVLKGVKAIGNAALGIQALFKSVGLGIAGFAALAVTALGSIPALAREMMISAAKAIRAGLEELGAPSAALDAFFGTEAELKARLSAATSSADEAGRKARGIMAGMKKDFGDLFGDIESFNNTIDTILGNIGRARGQAAAITLDRERTGATAAGAAAAPGAEEMTFAPEVVPGFAVLGGLTVEEFRAKMDGYGAGIDDIRAKLEAANLEQTMFDTLINDLAEAAGALGAQSFMNLGNSVAFAMGEMAAGTSTLSEFGDAMADLASRVAGDFGSLFVKMGAGFLVTPGMQGVGAGLIAAGLGLQVLSGFLGGKGSGNRGGGGRAGSASAARDIAREVTRSLRPSGEDGPMVTNIEVVIGGRSIQPEMVAIVDDIARQRRSRYLGRRMGV